MQPEDEPKIQAAFDEALRNRDDDADRIIEGASYEGMRPEGTIIQLSLLLTLLSGQDKVILQRHLGSWQVSSGFQQLAFESLII